MTVVLLIQVGDGPWDAMEEFDDELPQRKFDNFQFVPFHRIMERATYKEVCMVSLLVCLH